MSEQVSDQSVTAHEEPRERSWRSLWHIPALLGAVALLTFGLYRAAVTSPGPDHQSWLNEAQRLIDDREYEQAIQVLNKKLFPYHAKDELDAETSGSYHLLLGRAIAMGQQKLGVDREENHRNIVNSLAKAEELGATLTPGDIESVAEALLELEKVERALEWVERLGESDSERRVEILKHAIDTELAQTPDVDRDRVADMLATLASEPAASGADRVWSVARQSRMLRAIGETQAAVDRMLRELQRLDLQDPSVSSLYLELADAYLELGDPTLARARLDDADALISPRGEMRPAWQLLAARASDGLGEFEEARDQYGIVVSEFPSRPEASEALLGLARVQRDGGDTKGAIRSFEQLVERVNAAIPGDRVGRGQLTEVLLSHANEHVEAGDHENADAFSKLAENLYQRNLEDRPDELMLARANSLRGLADTLLEGLEPGVSAEALDPVSREEARRLLISAGSYYDQHSTRVVLDDPVAHRDSLFAAALAYDDAGVRERAIALLHAFSTSFPTDDRNAESRYRLGTAYLARGEYTQAADLFRGLIEDQREGGTNLGSYPMLSTVPLARAMLADNEESNDADAEDILRTVISGSVIRDPTPTLRRDALEVLARRQVETGDFLEASALYREIMERFADQPIAMSARSGYADANRLEARRLADLLESPLPIDEQQTYTVRRQEHLRTARSAYDELINEAGNAAQQGAELEMIRNAYLFRAACVYDLGDFDQAILYYDAAAQRYPDDPASLVALVQMVNAHVEMGDFDSARVAHTRAQRMFERFPDSAWEDPYLPMGREEWERWLESTGALYAAEAGDG